MIVKWTLVLVVLVVTGCDGLDRGTADAKRAVENTLFDPKSAQFSGLHRNTETGAYCGLVNATDLYGRSTGHRPFAVKGGIVKFALAPESLQVLEEEGEYLDGRFYPGMSRSAAEDLFLERERLIEEALRLKDDLLFLVEVCGVQWTETHLNAYHGVR